MAKHSTLNNLIRFQHIQQKDNNCVMFTNFITFIKSNGSQANTEKKSTLSSISHFYLSILITLLYSISKCRIVHGHTWNNGYKLEILNILIRSQHIK
jgi:hypothetical protein